ncbi:MraY family glycosyltransferase [Gemmata sp. JC717]|uniref:Undecaprenyl/decaprenyl-phosphate alpha-N-acetylglucosaminyl 1-phosphate transferase n=1 Tax=Gemmata algarum TaxID=2975278 RepID=A0ABU5EV18_9BACT|nr:MraY family glycosyltransferase [Gemmata algarum]MDY3552162.1 MraY family glycosyltransferase [Gemmata algarum]MDY3558302.1 undecaprenyl/decaprenyl-phosphate alpha-N-acetylglucosaminyl 1-phosphate transferase [Gemmata algarum]
MDSPVGFLAMLFALGLVCSVTFTGLARIAAHRIGLVDKPDGRRKMHGRVVPVAGGIAVFTSTVLVLAPASLLPGPVAEAVAGHLDALLSLLIASAMICFVGVVDDARGLRGRYKLCGQIVAVMVVVATGPQITSVSLFGWTVELGYLAIPLTAFWLLGAINSLNLLDGMDGLLGTVGTIICLAIAGMAAMHGQYVEACVAVTLAGALVGFLRYNLPPATIFLGDAGSMLIGLVIGVLAIRCSLKGPTTVALAAPAALLVLPIFDTLAAVVRRKLTGRSIFSTDRGHLHHCLLRGGLSRPRVLLLVASLCSVAVLGVLGSIACRNEMLAVASALTVVAILVTTRLFGHAEFVLLLQSARALSRSVLGGAPPCGKRLEVRLQGTAQWGELWTRLTDCAGRLNLRSVALDVNAPAHHEAYHARWSRPLETRGEEPVCWSAVLLLTAWGQTVGQVTVSGLPDGEPVWQKLAALARVTDAAETVLAEAARPAIVVPVVAAETVSA